MKDVPYQLTNKSKFRETLLQTRLRGEERISLVIIGL